MRTLLCLIAAALLISTMAFSAEQPKPSDEAKQFSGEIQKIDLQSKTLTLRLYPKKEKSAETASSAAEANASAAPKTEYNAEPQTSSATADNLKTFTFDDKTEIAALEADEKATTETKISDLDKGDEIRVHLNDAGLIEKIEIIAGD